MTRQAPPPQRLEPLMTSDDLAEILGIPVRTLDQWSYLGRGPRPIRIGKHRRYRPADVRSWLDRQPADVR